LAGLKADVLLIWNRSSRGLQLLQAADPKRCIYWEHGSAWFNEHDPQRAAFLRIVPVVIANSHAARRMLELRWQYSGNIRVCRNALQPDLMPAQPIIKTCPVDRAIRLGLAGRLLPIKGV